MEVLKGQVKVVRSSSSRSQSAELTSVPTMIALAGLTAFTMSAAYQLKTSEIAEKAPEVVRIETRTDAELITELRRENDELEKKLSPSRVPVAQIAVAKAPTTSTVTERSGERAPASIQSVNVEPIAASEGAQ